MKCPHCRVSMDGVAGRFTCILCDRRVSLCDLADVHLYIELERRPAVRKARAKSSYKARDVRGHFVRTAATTQRAM